jgi:hypothetical protein
VVRECFSCASFGICFATPRTVVDLPDPVTPRDYQSTNLASVCDAPVRAHEHVPWRLSHERNSRTRSSLNFSLGT